MKKCNVYKPVSYTHLDVYKRQDFGLGWSLYTLHFFITLAWNNIYLAIFYYIRKPRTQVDFNPSTASSNNIIVVTTAWQKRSLHSLSFCQNLIFPVIPDSTRKCSSFTLVGVSIVLLSHSASSKLQLGRTTNIYSNCYEYSFTSAQQ